MDPKFRIGKSIRITPEQEREYEFNNKTEEILKDLDALKQKVEELKKMI